MLISNYTARQFKKLPELNISSKIINTEARLYIADKKQNFVHINELLKIFYIQNDEYISEKVYVIGKLMSIFEDYDIPELVIPNSLVSISGEICGYSMEWIEDNINLKLLLNNPKVKVSESSRVENLIS